MPGAGYRGLAAHRHEWDTLAQLDPLWAILAYRGKKFGRWRLAEFLATGQAQVEAILARAGALDHPQRREAALDFGCGVGRLAPALSTSFDSYCGLDLSEQMASRARELHRSRPNCRFEVADDPSLARFPDSQFDLVASVYVLQHLTDRATVLEYVASMLRVLRPGGLLVVQLPSSVPRLEKLLYDSRAALYTLLGRLGVPARVRYRRLGLFPSTMNAVPEADVLALVAARGGRVLSIERIRLGIAIADRTYYVTKEP